MFSVGVFAQKTYIHAGRLIDVKTKKVLTGQTIIAVSGNPDQDIKVMKDVIFVMKEGKVYKQ